MGYQGINTLLKKSFFRGLPCFVHREHHWGHHMYGERYGVTIFTVVTNFNITVLEVPKLQKTIPRNGELPATLSRSVASASVNGRPKCFIIYYLIPITLISPLSCLLVPM